MYTVKSSLEYSTDSVSNTIEIIERKKFLFSASYLT